MNGFQLGNSPALENLPVSTFRADRQILAFMAIAVAAWGGEHGPDEQQSVFPRPSSAQGLITVIGGEKW